MPGCPMHPQPRARIGIKNAHEYSQRVHRKSPGIPTRNGFTTYIALSPVTGLLSPSLRIRFFPARLGWKNLRKLDASTGAPGPHDFAVRTWRSSCVPEVAQGSNPPCDHLTPDAAASTASRPASVTSAIRPFWWGETAEDVG